VRRLGALGLVTLAAAGCGGAAATTTVSAPKLPRPLARSWAQRADAVAAAAASGDGCRARDLATALRDDVAASRSRLPRPYRQTLLGSVDRLAAEISCTLPAQTVTVRTTTPAGPKPGPKPKPKPKPGPGHGKGHHKGHGDH
jgi:hypothetical protein